MNPLILAIDFDGTIAETNHNYEVPPSIFLPNAKEVINWLYDHGCYIIIWTCRNGNILKLAVDFLKNNEVKYHKINENSDSLDFKTSNKIYADYYIDDRSLDSNIDWLSIKEKIKKILIQRLANEIISVKFSGNNYDMPVMMRGKPNDENPGIGMTEPVQKMYDGVDRSKKKYDQKEIIRKKRDWLDDERILEDFLEHRYAGCYYVDFDTRDENSIDYYFENPKGTGESIPDAIKAVDKKEVKKREPLITRVYVDDHPYRRDETQKYLPNDQKLYNKRYWDERISPNHPKGV